MPNFSFGQMLAQLREIVDALRQRLGSRRPRADRSDAFLWRLQLVDRVFWVILAVLAGYLVIDLTILQPTPPVVPSVPSPTAGGQPTVPTPTAVAPTLKPVDEYQNVLTQRNPFQLAVQAVSQTFSGDGNQQKAEDPLEKLISTLNVVGINRGRVPEALIEDASTQRTHIVRVGDRINELKVKSIDEQGVTVTYEGRDALLP